MLVVCRMLFPSPAGDTVIIIKKMKTEAYSSLATCPRLQCRSAVADLSQGIVLQG